MSEPVFQLGTGKRVGLQDVVNVSIRGLPILTQAAASSAIKIKTESFAISKLPSIIDTFQNQVYPQFISRAALFSRLLSVSQIVSRDVEELSEVINGANGKSIPFLPFLSNTSVRPQTADQGLKFC